jgi:hypothetical protein
MTNIAIVQKSPSLKFSFLFVMVSVSIGYNDLRLKDVGAFEAQIIL